MSDVRIRTSINPDLLNALARLLEAAKGTSAEFGVASLIEHLCSPEQIKAAKS